MLDKSIQVGASFDWISPMLSIIGSVINGPSYTFLIPYDSCPMSGHDVARLLRKRGVQSWGRMVVSGTLMVSVRLEKARWAQHLLEQAGVPVENPLAEQDRRRSASPRSAAPRAHGKRRASPRRSEAGTLLDAVSEILDTPLF